MSRSPVEDVLPLSPLQEGLLFHALFDRESRRLYVAQFVTPLHGPLDAARLRAAAEALLERHPNLRVVFRHRRSGEPLQVVRRDAPLDWTEAGANAGDAAAVIDADWRRGMDVEGAALIRFLLVKEGPLRHRLVVTAHHCVIDGWSTALLFQELFDLYAGERLPPAPSFRDYLTWVARQDKIRAQLGWRGDMAGAEPTYVAPGAPRGEADPRTVTVRLPAGLTRELSARARECGVTVNTVVQTAWAILLGHMTGRDDVVFGTTVSGRPADLPGADTMVGMLINTVPVRAELRPDDTVRDVMERVQEQRFRLLAHDYLGLTDIHRAIGADRPLFDTTVAMDNYPMSDYAFDLRVEGLRADGVTVRETSHYAVTLVAVPGEELELHIHHRPDLFGRADVEAWAARLTRLFERFADDPGTRLRQIAPLTPEEQGRLLAAGTGPSAAAPECVHHAFERIASRLPDVTALIFEDRRVTYAELNERANRLAHHLAGLGVRPGAWAGVQFERGPDLVVAILAVLKAGGAYVLLDTSFPPERRREILGRAGAEVLVTGADLAERLGAEGVVVVRCDTDAAAVAAHSPAGPRSGVTPEDAACVLFTSGSQGSPKGVVAPHRAITATLAGQDFMELREGEVTLQCSPVSWDAFAAELFGPLTTGGTCVLQPGPVPEPEVIARLMAAHDVTTAHFSASLLNFLLDEHPGLLSRTRQLLTGGEAASMPHMRKALRDYPGLRIVNCYSPLECMMVSVWHRAAPQDLARPSLPLGRPTAGKRLYVLDANLRLVPPGFIGELYIAGAGLAHGYLGRPALTAERFAADPFGGPGERMYRTGDMVRWTRDGLLEFVGRDDAQFKLRGFRIEPAEVEAAITAHDGVADARVMVREDRPGDQRLVAYVIPTDPRAFDVTALRGHLTVFLPDYLRPAAFVGLEHFPVTPNGKLDRRALPVPDYGVTGGEAARDDREEMLCALFADVLGVEDVGIHDDFFRLGGHSLLALRLIGRLRASLGVDMGIATLFRHPTVAALAEQLGREHAPDPA
ncbi:hypothetical protein GCM10009677_33510 [Sphaerisporangium rubeum]|uniref:Amino acid adenylation domain-containing protein n=1 Tax=Sphaerisporangium rubeum TaxID=321317 RepID=A0A7X0IHQ7_9ACTN|nr:non-ribosomal peptide synthetase [Sphaerisporangium rubeum]MBB6474879.1 amino acid adenylation domain-containing protein [Sphaerisporangium rubeum]